MKLPTRARLGLALAATAATATGLVVPATAAPVPSGATWSSVYFPSKDGTSLHGDLLLPKGGCPAGGCPVVVSIGPYFGHSTQGSVVPTLTEAGPSDRFADFYNHEFGNKGTIFDQGYAWLQVDSRGYGVSGGCNDYGGRGEQQDVYAAVEWAGTQKWSNGKVGMWGKSYDAWTQVMGLAENPPHLEATVIQAPLIEGYGIGYVHGVHHSAAWYATTGLYALYDYTPNALDQTDPQALVNTTTGAATDPCWVEQAAIASAGNDHDLEYWRQRDLRPSASRNDDVAVLWSHGFNDVNTKPDQIFGVYGPLNDQPRSNHRAWFGQWAHDRGNEVAKVGRAGFLEESLDWFDHYLKGEPFEYEVNAKNVVEVQDNEGAWRTEAQYPPSDVRMFNVPLRTGTYTDTNSAGSGYWTVTQPVTEEFRITGEPVLNLEVTATAPLANVVGVLYDLDPASGVATEIARSAYRFETAGGKASFTMHPRDHVVRAGHRLAFNIASGHPQFQPHPTQQTVTVTQASVDLPVPAFERVSNLSGKAATARALTARPSAAQISAGSVTVPLPTTQVPDAAKREALQPTVSTPAD